MTVLTTISKAGPYAGAGTTGPFPVPFRFLANSHLRVVRTNTAGVDVDLVLNSGYTATGAGAASGSVTLTAPLAVGEKLTVSRNVPATQEADYVSGDAFPAESHELALDKLTMLAQQIEEETSRSLRVPVSATGVNPELPAPTPLRLLGWDISGNRLQNYNPDGVSESLLAQALAAPTGSSGVGFAQAGAGAVPRTAQAKLRECVSVRDFGAVGDGVTNDSAAVQAAINTGKRVYMPAGTYLCNVTISNKTILEGDGSTVTIVRPFNTATAAMTYTSLGDYWSYHSEVRGIGFAGVGTKTGVGFTFGATTQAGHFTNAQYANNVKFFACRFTNLEKGVQFPFGNIGSEFYSCGFGGNKYGVYTKDNSAGGDGMHAGCKYFYAGEFNSNECGFYCHDNTDGFGGIVFKDTIFEYNLVAAYIYTGASTFVPIKFDSVWFEGNGAMLSGAATVTIDAWSGSTRTDQTLTKRSVIIDGSGGKFNFDNCGIFTDIWLRASQTDVTASNCRVETFAGYMAGVSTVDTPSSSFIRMVSPYTNGGFLKGDGQIVVGHPTPIQPTISNNTEVSHGRWFFTQPRASKVASYGPSRAMSAALSTGATTGNGSFDLTGTVVSDGRIYASCNEFTRAAFASNQFTALNSPNSTITTSAGWYVFTLDFKRTAGNPVVYIWDRATAQFAGLMSAPALNKWYTMAAIGYSAGGQTLYLDFGGGSVTENCTWRISAYQIHRFDTLEQAQSFLASGAFAES